MDPNVALKVLREAVDSMNASYDAGDSIELHDVNDIIEHFQALDDWLQNGGTLPKSWQHYR